MDTKENNDPLFTTQEQRVIDLITEKLSIKEIATMMQISESTVQSYRMRIRCKMIGIKTENRLLKHFKTVKKKTAVSEHRR